MKNTIDTIIQKHKIITHKAVDKLLVEVNSERVKLQKRIDCGNKFLEIYQKLEKALNKVGLSVCKENILIGVSEISIRLIPFDGKFKFIKDEGYTKSGSGKNQTKLNKKAEKLRNLINDVTQLYFKCAINQFSLEESEVNRIICDLYFLSNPVATTLDIEKDWENLSIEDRLELMEVGKINQNRYFDSTWEELPNNKKEILKEYYDKYFNK